MQPTKTVAQYYWITFKDEKAKTNKLIQPQQAYKQPQPMQIQPQIQLEQQLPISTPGKSYKDDLTNNDDGDETRELLSLIQVI